MLSKQRWEGKEKVHSSPSSWATNALFAEKERTEPHGRGTKNTITDKNSTHNKQKQTPTMYYIME